MQIAPHQAVARGRDSLGEKPRRRQLRRHRDSLAADGRCRGLCRALGHAQGHADRHVLGLVLAAGADRKRTRLNSSHRSFPPRRASDLSFGTTKCRSRRTRPLPAGGIPSVRSPGAVSCAAIAIRLPPTVAVVVFAALWGTLRGTQTGTSLASCLPPVQIGSAHVSTPVTALSLPDALPILVSARRNADRAAPGRCPRAGFPR